MEDLPGPGCGRPPLSLVPGAALLGPVRELRGAAPLQDGQLPDLDARPHQDRQTDQVGQIEGDVPCGAGVDEPGGGVRDQAQTPEGRLPLQAAQARDPGCGFRTV